MKIIMLVGPENSGKTSALHQVLLMMKKADKKNGIVLNQRNGGRTRQIGGDTCDFKCVAKY